MSLVSNEGDSEQNEIRNLQEKLESTMSLVKQLSGQLAELKEQVSKLGGREGEPRNSRKETSPTVLCGGISASRDSSKLPASISHSVETRGELFALGDRSYFLPGIGEPSLLQREVYSPMAATVAS